MAIKPSNPDQVTVIGLGNMGSALADRLLATKYSVTVWNRTASKCNVLAEAGANVAGTPAEAISVADTIVICVLDITAVQSILSSSGVADALDGRTVIQLSALEPDQSREQGKWMRQRHVRYLDGGILAFPADVREGTAKIAYSGSKDAFEYAQSMLRSFGPDLVFVGEQAGMAPLAAMIVYARYYGLTFACMHAAALAAAAGIPARTFLDLSGGEKTWQFIGRTMDDYVAMTEKRDYSTNQATLEMDASGYDFFVRLSRELGVDPAFHEMIESVISSAIKQGRGDQAISAIFEVLSDSSSS